MNAKPIPANAVKFECGTFDHRVNLYDEYKRSLNFVRYGVIEDTRKMCVDQLKGKLAEIGYVKEDHAKYNFYLIKSTGDFGTDYRHIFIAELGEYFSYI